MLRRLPLIVALVAVGALLTPGTASAATVSTDCSGFPGTLATATAGETIILNGVCNLSGTIPAAATNLTIEGAAGTNGFDGGGTRATPALTGTSINGLTLRNLVFANYNSVAVQINTSTIGNPYVIDGDTFTNDHGTGSQGAGGLFLNLTGITACPTPDPSVTIANSTFTNNSTAGVGPGDGGAEGGGGGAHVLFDCNTGGGTPTATVTGNTFSGNVVNAGVNPRQGGGLWIAAVNTTSIHPLAVTQSGNLFSGNSVTGAGADYAGGGEFTAGVNFASTSDRFIGNSLPGSSILGASSEGGGLSTRNGGGCTAPGTATSTATNLVAAGNTIGAPSGTGTGGEGAGIYAGCAIGTGGYDLTLKNSTVAGNTATGSGAVAGADGEATDHLHLLNTILTANSGGDDLGGFGASAGANADAANSDVCAPGSGSPFAGPANICANPALVNAATGDVHETLASPTLDKGFNGFVSVPTDVFGGPRILTSKPGDPPTVDIGAAEFKMPSNGFSIVGVKGKTLIVNLDSPGKLVVTQNGAGSSAARSATAVEAKKKKKKKKKLLNLSSASGGPGQVSIPLLLTKKGKKQLKSKGKVNIGSTVTFTPTGGEPNAKGTTLRIKNKKKKKK